MAPSVAIRRDHALKVSAQLAALGVAADDQSIVGILQGAVCQAGVDADKKQRGAKLTQFLGLLK